MVKATGELVERVAYTPYGRGRHHWGSDVNRDGHVDAADAAAIAAALDTELGDQDYDPKKVER